MCLFPVFSEIANKEIHVNKWNLKLDNQDNLYKKVGITMWFKMFIRIISMNSGTTSLVFWCREVKGQCSKDGRVPINFHRLTNSSMEDIPKLVMRWMLSSIGLITDHDDKNEKWKCSSMKPGQSIFFGGHGIKKYVWIRSMLEYMTGIVLWRNHVDCECNGRLNLTQNLTNHGDIQILM